MKTAISVPDEIFDQATKRARELGMSRSEFFSRAASRYLDHFAKESLTIQIDAALRVARVDDSWVAAAHAGRRRVAEDEDW